MDGNFRVGEGRFDPEVGMAQYEGLKERYEVPLGPASEKGYAQHHRLEKVRYSHDAMIDMIVAEPRVTQKELASRFGFSLGWINRVIGSDAFQTALAKRKAEVTDPFLIATVEERLSGLARQSLDVIAEKLEATQSVDVALKAADMSLKAMGFGSRDRGAGVVNNFVVALPGKAPDAQAWMNDHTPGIKVIGPRIEPISTTTGVDPLVQPNDMTIVEEG